MSLTIILNHLRSSIDSRFIVDPISGSTIKLTEEEEQAICREVRINTKDVSIKPIVINFDKRIDRIPIDVHPVLSKEAGLKSGCDYLLICPVEQERKIYLLLIELKSLNSGGWIDQCIAGECLTRYLISTIDRVKQLNLDFELVFRYICFKAGVKKRTTGTAAPIYTEDKSRGIQYATRLYSAEHNLKILLQ